MWNSIPKNISRFKLNIANTEYIGAAEDMITAAVSLSHSMADYYHQSVLPIHVYVNSNCVLFSLLSFYLFARVFSSLDDTNSTYHTIVCTKYL